MKKSLLILLCLMTTLSGQAQTELSGKSLLGGLRARHIGPAVMSGRIADIEVVNRKPTIIYVGSASGGVWKSVSAGASFRPIFDDYTMSIGKVTLDQNHPDTVWVGTGEPWVRNSTSVGTGVYKSVNGGTSWEFVGLKDSERISDILINPKEPNTVYVGVQGHLWNANTERGVYKTTDGGKTWNRILYIDENTGCADMEMDPKNPDILYAAMWSHRRYPDFFDSGFTGTSGLYKSTDGGKTWNKIHNGLPTTTLGRIGIAAAPSNGNILYASVESKDIKGMYRSNDAGASWKLVNTDFNNGVRPFYFSRLTVDPKHDSILVKCAFTPIISTDGGKKFRPIQSVHSDVHAAWIDPNNTNHILLGTDGGVYESLDQGYTFKMWMNLPVGQFYHVAADNETPYNLYGGLQDNGSWFGPSQKPGGVGNSDWHVTYGGDGFWSSPHPTDNDVLYAEAQGGQAGRYNKKTGIAKDIKPYQEKNGPKLRFNWNTPIVQSPNKADRIYMGSQFVHMSDDRGDTWKRISPDLSTNDPKRQRQGLDGKPSRTGGLSIDNSSAENNTIVYYIAESPKDEKVIWAGTDDGNLQVTENQGGNWANVTKNMIGLAPGNWCSSIEAGHFDRATAYVTFDNHRNGDMKPYIYKTTDMGKTFTSLVTPDIEGYVWIIREDRVNPNLLYAGTEFGLYISVDGGKKWYRFENNVPKVAVHDILVHPKEDAVILATHGRALMIIDDISPLRQFTPEVMAKPIHFFTSQPTVLNDPGAGGNWFGGDGNYTGENPSSLAKIVYWMSKRHTFGKMTIEVYGQDGQLIREVPAGKSAGINVVEMTATMEKPKAAPSENPQAMFGTLFGPNLPAGTYKVKVIKGKDEYWTSFTLKYPDSSPYTAEDRKVQAETTMRLYKQIEHIGYLYSAQDGIIKQAKAVAQKNPKMGKLIDPLVKALQSRNDSLVFRGGDFYINTEEKLAEEVSGLYGQVTSYPGRPGATQVERVGSLDEELKKVDQKFEKIKKDKLKKVNDKLTSDKLFEPIKVQTEEEFKKGETGGGGIKQNPFNWYYLLRR